MALKIAVDMDDVVVDFFSRVVKCYNTEYDQDVQLSDVVGWDDNPIKLSPHFGEGRQFTNWWVWWETRRLWSDCKAIPGAIGGLGELHNAGHYIQLVTSKPIWARSDTTKWLSEWDPYFDDIVIVEEGSGKGKHEVSNATVLIDDKPQNVRDWCNAGRLGILFTRPWNVDMEFASVHSDALFVAQDWTDVVGLVGNLVTS